MARSRTLAVALVALLLLTGCAGLVADSIEALMKQGIELFLARRYDEAILKFLEVVRRDPRSWEAHLYLARSYVATRSWGNAIASGRRALELAPGASDAVSTLAEALLGAGLDALERRQFSEAAGHLVEYVKLRPLDVQGYLELARAFLGSRAYADALRTIVQGLTRALDAGARAELLRALRDSGTQALAAGNGRAAIGFLQEYVRHDAGDVSAYLALGKAYWADGNVASALAAFRRVLELSPNNAEALQFMGRGR
jgi:cytochrome c-type biogenesis protein CcmH/NrfG